MYCKNCGEQLLPGQKFCSNCGAAAAESMEDRTAVTENPEDYAEKATVSEERATEKPIYKGAKYKPQVIKISVLTLCAQIASFFLVLALVFLPMYVSSPSNINAIQDMDDLREIFLNDGKMTFSLWDDLKLIFDALISGMESGDESISSMLILEMGMFPLFELLMIIFLLVSIGMSMYEQINNLCNAEDSTLLKYNEIKKSGMTRVKPSFWKKQTIFTVVIYAIFDIIFTKIIGKLMLGFSNTDCYRNMMDFSGISFYAVIVIVLLVGLAVVQTIAKSAEKNMKLSIAKEEILESQS